MLLCLEAKHNSKQHKLKRHRPLLSALQWHYKDTFHCYSYLYPAGTTHREKLNVSFKYISWFQSTQMCHTVQNLCCKPSLGNGEQFPTLCLTPSQDQPQHNTAVTTNMLNINSVIYCCVKSHTKGWSSKLFFRAAPDHKRIKKIKARKNPKLIKTPHNNFHIPL